MDKTSSRLTNRRACVGERGLSRRRFVAGVAVGALAPTAGVLSPRRLLAAVCDATPEQYTGPFYPNEISDHDWDLTRIPGGTGRAEGMVIEVSGRVLGDGCEPVANAWIEVWQANVHGRYAHPSDPNPAPLDPNFEGYARLLTDSDGRYRILTIKPGAYPVAPLFPTPDWVRPPHIHFKVHDMLGSTLTTQMYFAGEPLNEKDPILTALPEAERQTLIVGLSELREDGVPRATFDLVISGNSPPQWLLEMMQP